MSLAITPSPALVCQGAEEEISNGERATAMLKRVEPGTAGTP
jgi:hypothetical protein